MRASLLLMGLKVTNTRSLNHLPTILISHVSTIITHLPRHIYRLIYDLRNMTWRDTFAPFGIFLIHLIMLTTPEAERPSLPKKTLWLQTLLKVLAPVK
jgi:hypothetical protein